MSIEDHEQIWILVEAGESYADIGKAIGRALTTVRDFVNKHDGVRPALPVVWSDQRMSMSDREEISRGLVADESFRSIAARLGRAPSTVSREVNRNGGRTGYRAAAAEQAVHERARRPRPSRLATHDRLREVVDDKLGEFWSPQQVDGWLRLEYPNDPEMRVSHESIYLALYAGVLKMRPKQCLRTRRPRRRRRNRRRNHGQGVIKNPVMISQRPTHVEDRVEVGHWEGDLIIGNRSTALATLVERATRFTILVPLPGARTMVALNKAVTAAFSGLDASLKRSLAWDQGKEIAGHEALAAATGMTVYLCNPHSPWQRGSNENTNGLIRQWFLRSTNFYTLDPHEVAATQTSLNNRPRRIHGYRTPADILAAAS